MTDALFDLELPPLFMPELSTETGKCRDCHYPVKGKYTRYSQGRSEEGFWVQCDDCNPLGRLPVYERQDARAA